MADTTELLPQIISVSKVSNRPDRPDTDSIGSVWDTELASINRLSSNTTTSQSKTWLNRRKRGSGWSGARPLGLIPHHQKVDVWSGLKLLMHPTPAPLQAPVPVAGHHYSLPVHHPPSAAAAAPQDTAAQLSPGSPGEPMGIITSAKVTRRKDQSTSVYRLPVKSTKLSTDTAAANEMTDEDYLHTLAQIDMYRLYESREMNRDLSRMMFPSSHCTNTQQQHIAIGGLNTSTRTSAKVKRSSRATLVNEPTLEYLSFTGQSHLNRRLFSTDLRDSLEHEPCERCRLRGTRCSRCIAIRTGGGYIILDGLASDSQVMKKGYRKDWEYHGGGTTYSFKDGRAARRRDKTIDDSEMSQSSFRDFAGRLDEERGGGLKGKGSKHVLSGRWGGDSGEWDGGGGSGHLNQRSHDGRNRDLNTTRYDEESSMSRSQNRLGQHGKGDSSGLGYTNESSMDNIGRRRDLGGHGNEELDAANDDRMRGHRPGSRTGGLRPRSSLNRGDPREREREEQDPKTRRTREDTEGKGVHLNKLRASGSRKGTGNESGDDESADEGEGRGKGKKQKRTQNDSEDSNDTATGRKIPPKGMYLGKVREKEEEDETSERQLGDLMKFKSKRDNVKVKECSLKELQGIDPLDYLAKYCIIDQAKVPHYQQVFDNVDRDEDELITVQELDFALKAVNYNLISDSEMEYINSILELAGRYALNFQLFSLVAALSERVVALDDMVKRLINSMDFEALETKMKKCKELFYLLANDKEGVVTTRDLAVELQAGGLTEEHVEFVTDRLNYEGQGTVQFLDYLTYVPLFVEIHDNINDNPLDFTRNR